MSQEQAVEKLVDQVNSDMGVFLAIISIMVAVFLYFQWRLSDSQVKRMKSEIKSEIAKEYNLDELNRKVGEIVKENADQLYRHVEDAFANLDAKLLNGEKYPVAADSIATSIYNNMLYILSSKTIDSENKQKCIKSAQKK